MGPDVFAVAWSSLVKEESLASYMTSHSTKMNGNRQVRLPTNAKVTLLIALNKFQQVCWLLSKAPTQ